MVVAASHRTHQVTISFDDDALAEVCRLEGEKSIEDFVVEAVRLDVELRLLLNQGFTITMDNGYGVKRRLVAARE